MKRKDKKQIVADLLSGKIRTSDLMRPDGIIIQHGDKYRINTALGEQEVNADQLNRIRGDEQGFIFIPDNNR
jgi:hypothetical protein